MKRGVVAREIVWWRKAQRLGGAVTDVLWWCVDKTEKEKEKREERAWQGKCALKLEQL